MIKNYFILLLLISFYACSDEQVVTGEDIVFDETEAITGSIWTIKKITVKYGTQDPDAAVPLSQMEEINSGNELTGEIHFNPDGTITISNARDEFYFTELNEVQWGYKNRFIIFRHSSGGFGYNVQWYGNKHMRWYIGSTGIESGSGMVTIIELMAN